MYTSKSIKSLKPEGTKQTVKPLVDGILLFFIIGGLLGEQFRFLIVFYPKYWAHWVVSVVLFSASTWVTQNLIGSNRWRHIYLTSMVLFVMLLGLKSAFKLQEYSHLSYLLSYVLMIIVATFFGSCLDRVKREVSWVKYFFMVLSGLVGFLWTYLFWMPNVYLFVALFALAILNFPDQKGELRKYKLLVLALVISLVIGLQTNWRKVIVYPTQSQYTDKVVHSVKTDHHYVDITKWKGDYWYYYNGRVQFSSVDEWLYSESMVHPLMKLLHKKKHILVVGGENGILLKELLKYTSVKSIDLYVLDSTLYALATENPLFTKVNLNSLKKEALNEHYGDLHEYLNEKKAYYDAIFVDIPDPINEQWNTYYTKEFYQVCHASLDSAGMMITQAGSPYFATKAFLAIERTVESADFNTLPLHNQILTLGEWGWVLGSKNLDSQTMKSRLLKQDQISVSTKWLNVEAMQMLISFGKSIITPDSVEINTSINPVLIDYYKEGNFRFR